MAITNLPTPPARSDTPTNFINNADAFIAALPTFVTEANAQAAALTLNSTIDTSTTSNTIDTGAKTFNVSSGKSFQPAMFLVIGDTAAPTTNYLICQVTSYSGTTLIVNVIQIGGSGTKTAWTISQSASLNFNGADVQKQTYTAFTTGGTSSAFTLTPTPAITANTTNQRFNITLNAAPTGSPTLAVSGLTAKSLKYYDQTGAKQFVTSAVAPINWNSDVIYDGADWVMQDVVVPKNKTFIGSFTRNMAGATTTQVITGVGFTPRKVRFFMSNPANGTTAQFSIGEDNGTSAFCVYDSNVTTANTNAIDTSNSIRAQGAASNQTGKISAFSSDGFTISWTLTSTGAAFTGTISYVAED